MKSLFNIFSQGSAWRRGLSAAAAVLLLAVLVGSMAAVFALTGHGKSASPNHTTVPAETITTVTPTEPPPPPPTPGMYLITQKDWYTDQISKVDPQTRKTLWSQTIGQTESSIVVYGNTLYLSVGDSDYTTYNHYVYALDATSGALRWKMLVSHDPFQAPESNQPLDLGVLAPPVIDNGILYVGARDGKLYALDATSGAQLWVYDAHAIAFAGGFLEDANQVAVAQGVVYGAIHNALYALDARTGKALWTSQIVNTQLYNGPVIANGILYISSYEEDYGMSPESQTGYAYAYTIQGGKQLWRYSAGAWVLSSPTVANGVVYFGSYNNNLYALKASNGSELWHYHTSGEIFDQPIVADGVVYIDSGNSEFAISASGKLVWSVYIKNLIYQHTVQQGVVYVAVDPGQLYALSVKDGSILWHQKFGATLIDKTGSEGEFAPILTLVS